MSSSKSIYDRDNINIAINQSIELSQNNQDKGKQSYRHITSIINSYGDININMKLHTGHSDKYKFKVFNSDNQEIGIFHLYK